MKCWNDIQNFGELSSRCYVGSWFKRRNSELRVRKKEEKNNSRKNKNKKSGAQNAPDKTKICSTVSRVLFKRINRTINIIESFVRPSFLRELFFHLYIRSPSCANKTCGGKKTRRDSGFLCLSLFYIILQAFKYIQENRNKKPQKKM